MRDIVQGVAAVVVLLVTASCSATSNKTAGGCGEAVELPDASGPIRPLTLGPLSLGAGVKGGFTKGYPYKVSVSREIAADSVRVRGWNCSDGKRLRFAYNEPFRSAYAESGGRRYSESELQRMGDLVAEFRPHTPPVGQDKMFHTGYMLFWEAGKWKLEVRVGEEVVGELVMRLE